jgi:two-component system chemotaxis sensor kinase CheA
MDDLVTEFIEETTESLSLLDSELIRFEQNPNDQEILGNIFRLVHTIKGTCGFLGLPRLESVAHAGENVLGKIRDGELGVTQEAISLVLEALDRIRGLIEHLAAHGAEPDGEDGALITQLNAYAEHGPAPGASQPAEDAGQATAQVAAESEEAAETAISDAPARDDGMVSSVSADALDEMERAFLEADVGDMDFTKAPDIDWDAVVAEQGEAESVTEAENISPESETNSLPAETPNIDDTTKEAALQKGLEADAKEQKASAGGGAAVGAQSIRVNIDVLESLMQMVGELVLTRNQLLQLTRASDDREMKGPLQQLSHITTELQDGVMKTRMQPISNAWSKFPRLIRDLSKELGKQIDLKMLGETTELDRQVLEMIRDPLTHMVRNSCDHGLETTAGRREAGKPETGTVTLSAYHEGGHIIIEIIDDGRGVNIARVKEKALENGLATQSELNELSDDQIAQFIFKAGFSTAEAVTSVSGRGVGMDVVRTNIEKIGGTIELKSVPGEGSTFMIKIPLTLAIVSVLIVEANAQRFAIPQLNVVEMVRIGVESEYKLEMINQSQVLRLRDTLLPLVTLRQLLGQPAREMGEEEDAFVAVVRVGATDFGLIVDKIHDTEEIVVKPVASVMSGIDLYSGNTILGDGSVIMILDPNGLSRAMGASDLSASAEPPAAKERKQQESDFLVFRSGEGAPKAVPLELVSRLEEIDMARVEQSNGTPVLQYRGELMRLHCLDGRSVPESGIHEVVVFNYDGQTVGMVVDEIVDIIRAPVDIKIASANPAYLGSMVIGERTTDIIDLSKILETVVVRKEAESSFAGTRMLYVEDSVFFRNLTVPFFTKEGMVVTSAGDGEEALQKIAAASTPFDLIVTDIEMPKMDGLTLASRLRAMEETKHLPIIGFSSTAGNDQFEAKARDCGINYMVSKTERHVLFEIMGKYVAGTKEVA